MDSDFWHSRWSEGRIGFHEGKPNAHLVKHLGVLKAAKRVLVPLCGKAEDLAFLASQGHEVVGLELVESAVKAFFDERGVTPEVSKHGPYARYVAANVTVLAGDFFASTRELLGAIDAVYDRAAVIALPAAMRGDYVKHLRTLLPPGAPGLIVTVEYPQDEMDGPPFSVPEAELRAHYAGLSIDRIDQVVAELARLPSGSGSEKVFRVRF
ncbi:MAG: thiopurine S-methyltransferase [Archangium sp.]|nr:thiopurine S-methyltransferase [Archangium sp.]